jgi:membrane protein
MPRQAPLYAYAAQTPAARRAARPRLGPRQIARLIRASFAAWGEDYASSMGAALAFYTIVSAAPVLLIAMAVAGLVFDTQEAQQAVASQLASLIGSQAAGAVEILLGGVHSPSGTWISTGAGVALLLIGASAVFGELQDALNRIWRTELPRPPGLLRLVRSRVLSFGMVLGVGLLLIVSLVLSATIAAFAQWWGDAVGHEALFLEAVNFVVSFGLITVAFALLYKLLPRASVQWHDVWIGAMVTAFLFTVGKSLIGIYLGRSGVASAYGAFGSLIAMLLWVYYSAQIFLLGAEFTWLYAHSFGSHRERPRPGPASAIPRRPQPPAPETPILVRPWSEILVSERPARRPPGGAPPA